MLLYIFGYGVTPCVDDDRFDNTKEAMDMELYRSS